MASSSSNYDSSFDRRLHSHFAAPDAFNALRDEYQSAQEQSGFNQQNTNNVITGGHAIGDKLKYPIDTALGFVECEARSSVNPSKYFV